MNMYELLENHNLLWPFRGPDRTTKLCTDRTNHDIII